jgi:hypothetical protein
VHWPLFRAEERCGGGGGSAVRKIYCTGPWKLATIQLYNPLKPPEGVHVHKTTYGPLIDTVMLLMCANPLLWQARGGWALEILTFLSPLTARFPGPNPLPLVLVMDLLASKALHVGPYKS